MKTAVAVAAALAMLATGAQAQMTAAMPSGNAFYMQEPGAPPMPPPEEAISVIGAEMGPGHAHVTGAPVSAQMQTETTQTLADGTHIDRKTSGEFYRDNQGRVRLEVSHPPLAAPAAATPQAGPAIHEMIFIMDPVAQVHYVLEPARKVAHQMPFPGGEAMKHMIQEWHGDGDQKDVTTESLGTQTINGLNATGTRTTRTIPVGAIGNDNPIRIVTERWYSPALQMNIMTKRTDPRTGTTTYQLTNISREEPSASLFQVPADYTVEQGGPMHMRHSGMGAPPPPPAPAAPAAPSAPGDQPNSEQ